MSLAARLLRRSGLRSLSRLCVGRSRLAPVRCVTDRISENGLPHCLSPLCFRTLSQISSKAPCWKCGKSERKADFFCENCNALQKPDANYNFFHLFGLKDAFDLNTAELSKTFRQLQSVVHPDKFSNASADEMKYSADLSSVINKAFRTLSDPLERGFYLLSLKGLSILEENTSLNKAFLLEIMELNEELESISTLNELKEFDTRNKETLSSIQQKVSESFNSQDIDSARAALMEMKYFTTLDGKVKEKMMLLDTV